MRIKSLLVRTIKARIEFCKSFKASFQSLAYGVLYADHFNQSIVFSFVIEEYSLVSLFFSAFISSTLLPGGSELVLIYLATQTEEKLLILWLVSTVGNTLGGLTSWGLGYWLIKRFPDKGLDEQKHQRALGHIRRWGSASLIFSWLPVIGDPLCFVAGWLKLSLLWSGLFIAVGKGLRYALILLML